MTPPAPRSKDRKKVFVDASSAILLYKASLFALKNFMSMDKGEKETIQIFCNLTRFGLPGVNFPDPKTKDFILVDDGQAARFCQAQQIPFINQSSDSQNFLVFWRHGPKNVFKLFYGEKITWLMII